MNPFYFVRDALELKPDTSNHPYSWLYAILELLGLEHELNPRALESPNPFTTVIARVRAVCGNSFAAQQVERLLSYRADQFGVA